MADIKNINNVKDEVTQEKRIDLYDLVENYKKRSSIKLKEEYLKSQVKVKPYLSYGVKMFLADQIVKQSCLKDGNVYVDSCKKYLLYIYTLIKYYTNIDISEKDLMLQYDLLDENELVEKILALIPEKELISFKTILDMKQDDLMTNKYGTYAFIEDQVERIRSITPEITKAFAPLIDVLSNKIETLDENKLEKMIGRAMKYIK